MADPHDLFLFHCFLLDRRGGGLFRRDEHGGLAPVAIGARALDVLGALVERAGDVVTRDEIIAAAWPEAVVEDNNLNMQIAALRRTLDDGATATSCIQTVPRRGYRFITPVLRDRRPAASVAQIADAPEPDPAVPLPDTNSRSRYQLRGRVIAWAAGALIVLAVATVVLHVQSRWLAGDVGVPRLSIVVLPFANLSGDPAQQYFADGITEDLTTDLSRLADMLVISRDTAFIYKGKAVSAKRVRGELGVRYMLEGSVQRSDNEVRINAQLIDTDSDTNLWVEQFDRNIGDLLALQSEITGRIAIALNVKLIVSEAARPTERPDALDHIFRGRAARIPAGRRARREELREGP